MHRDPIVEEVRKIRLSIEEECHNDFTEIFNRIKEREKRSGKKMVSKPLNKVEQEMIA